MRAPEGRIRLHAPPTAARIVAADLDAVCGELLSAMLAEAHARGVAAGRQQLSEEARSAIEALNGAVEHLSATRTQIEEEAGDFAVQLAIEIARHVLRRELDEGRYDLERIVRETLAESGVGRGNCVVHLSPRDHETLCGVSFRGGTVLEEDPGVPRGDVHVTTSDGVFVRDVDALLQRLADRIRGEAP